MRFINFLLSVTFFATIASALVLPVSFDLERRDIDLDVRNDLFDLEEFAGREYEAYDLMERNDNFESELGDVVFKRTPVHVSWHDPNTYKNNPTQKAHVENTVHNSAHTSNAEGRGASHAIIQGGVHKSPKGGDQRDHVTVHYKKPDGSHVTTKHVHT